MNLVKLIEFLRRRLKKVIWVCLVALALLIVADLLFVDKKDAHTGVEKFPVFWAAFGFAGCALIIILSKCYGHAGIMQREDYYDE